MEGEADVFQHQTRFAPFRFIYVTGNQLCKPPVDQIFVMLQSN